MAGVLAVLAAKACTEHPLKTAPFGCFANKYAGRTILTMNSTNAHTATPKGKPAAEIRNRLRAQAKAARKALPKETKATKSARICAELNQQLDTLLSENESGTFTVAVYAAFPWEANLGNFISHAYSQECTVAFPCMMPDAHGIPDAVGRGMREPGSDPAAPHITQQTMEMRAVPAEAFRINSVPFLNDPLKEYRHDSPELSEMPYVAASEIDFLVVPAVGFDEHGNRLGYGAGNYDRYLSQLTDVCHVAGVAFAEQKVGTIPAEPHDIPLPFVSA